MDILNTVWSFLQAKFEYLYTAVSGVFSVILSEIPDDEIAILHGCLVVAGDSLKAGRTPEETFSDCLNYLQQQEKQELSKVTELLLQAFIQATAPKPA